MNVKKSVCIEPLLTGCHDRNIIHHELYSVLSIQITSPGTMHMFSGLRVYHSERIRFTIHKQLQWFDKCNEN